MRGGVRVRWRKRRLCHKSCLYFRGHGDGMFQSCQRCRFERCKCQLFIDLVAVLDRSRHNTSAVSISSYVYADWCYVSTVAPAFSSAAAAGYCTANLTSGGVNTFSARSGTVVPTTGDYTCAQVTNCMISVPAQFAAANNAVTCRRCRMPARQTSMHPMCRTRDQTHDNDSGGLQRASNTGISPVTTGIGVLGHSHSNGSRHDAYRCSE